MRTFTLNDFLQHTILKVMEVTVMLTEYAEHNSKTSLLKKISINLCIKKNLINFQTENTIDDPLSEASKTVGIQCLWDNLHLHVESGPPMYILWKQNPPSSPLLKALLTDQTYLNKK